MSQPQSDTMWKDLEQMARAFAQERHASQKYGEHAYEVHLAHVRRVLASFDYHGALGVAAWLHDTIEDTNTSREEIEQRFGIEVANLVWAVTGVGSTRKERNASAYEKIRAFPNAAILKLADRIANVEASQSAPEKFAKYREEWPNFRSTLENLGDQHMWAYLESFFSEHHVR